MTVCSCRCVSICRLHMTCTNLYVVHRHPPFCSCFVQLHLRIIHFPRPEMQCIDYTQEIALVRTKMTTMLSILLILLKIYVTCLYDPQYAICRISYIEINIHNKVYYSNVYVHKQTYSSIYIKEEYRLKVFENRILRRTFGPKRDVNAEWRRLHNEELRTSSRSPNIVKMVKSRRLG